MIGTTRVVNERTPLLDAWLAQNDLMERLLTYSDKVGGFVKVLSDEHIARELTVADVARMVDCPIEDIVRIARGQVVSRASGVPCSVEPYADCGPTGDIVGCEGITIDTRPIFEAGHEPLGAILLAVGALEGGEILEVISPFEPKPLRRLLAHRGFHSHASEVAPNHWRTIFARRPDRCTVPEPPFAFAAVFCEEPGPTGHVLTEVASELEMRGHRLAGVVQSRPYSPDDAHCDMELRVLPTHAVVPITQNLGSQASSCRLDHQSLEDAVALVDRALTPDTEILLINKFGKREADGAGFRQTIARAVEAGIPVVVGVGKRERPSLDKFIGGACPILANDGEEILAWCLSQLSHS